MHTDSDKGDDAASLPANVKLLGWTSLLNDTATEAIFPLLSPFVVKVLHGSLPELGIIEGLADTVASLVKLWSGGWSDRAGSRKGFVVFGYSLAAVARPLIALASAPWQVVAIRATDRFGKGVRAAPRDALIADATDPKLRGRAFGFNRAMDHLGAAIGPLFAASFLWFYPDAMRTLFALTLVPGLAVIALVLFGLREKKFAPVEREPLRLTLKPFDRRFRLFLIALLVFTLGNSSDIFLLWRAEELGVKTWALPLLWAAFHVVKSATALVGGRAADRFGPRPLIFIGWALYALVYLAFGLATTAWQAWAIFFVYAIFYALTEPSEKVLVANLVGAERKGLAFGWYNFAIGIMALPSSFLFGLLYKEVGARAAFGWGAAMAALAVGILALVRPQSLDRAVVGQAPRA